MPGHAHGFGPGFFHPFLGLDHLIAMVAVGLWASQLGGRARWSVPLAFVSFMVIGGVLGMGGNGISYLEQGIAASVLVLGLLIAAAVRLPLAASMAVVGLFALFHGYAHGAEMSAAASGLIYGAGFVMATISMHLAGLGLGLLAQRFAAAPCLRYAGAAIAIGGVCFCFAS